MEFTVLEYIKNTLIILAILSFAIYFILVNYRSHRRNNAPEETAPAVAYQKHPEVEYVTVRTNVGIRNDSTHYITFHTDTDDILKLYMNSESFHRIQEGDRGLLTWQADRFWRFEKEE